MKTKHRKAARAKREILTGMTSFEQTIRGCKTPEIDEQILLVKFFRAAFNRLAEGNGTVTDFVDIDKALHYAKSCCQFFSTPEDAEFQSDLIQRGIDAMARMRERNSRGLALRFDGEGLQHAGEALDIYFDFLATLSRRQLSDAMTDALEYLQHRERERAATV